MLPEKIISSLTGNAMRKLIKCRNRCRFPNICLAFTGSSGTIKIFVRPICRPLCFPVRRRWGTGRRIRSHSIFSSVLTWPYRACGFRFHISGASACCSQSVRPPIPEKVRLFHAPALIGYPQALSLFLHRSFSRISRPPVCAVGCPYIILQVVTSVAHDHMVAFENNVENIRQKTLPDKPNPKYAS